jgi:hypothetical protein
MTGAIVIFGPGNIAEGVNAVPGRKSICLIQQNVQVKKGGRSPHMLQYTPIGPLTTRTGRCGMNWPEHHKGTIARQKPHPT